MPARKTPSKKTLGKRKPAVPPANPLAELALKLANNPDGEVPLEVNGVTVGYLVTARRLSQLKANTALVTREDPAPEREVKLVSDIKQGLRRIKDELAEGLSDEWHDLNHR